MPSLEREGRTRFADLAAGACGSLSVGGGGFFGARFHWTTGILEALVPRQSHLFLAESGAARRFLSPPLSFSGAFGGREIDKGRVRSAWRLPLRAVPGWVAPPPPVASGILFSPSRPHRSYTLALFFPDGDGVVRPSVPRGCSWGWGVVVCRRIGGFPLGRRFGIADYTGLCRVGPVWGPVRLECHLSLGLVCWGLVGGAAILRLNYTRLPGGHFVCAFLPVAGQVRRPFWAIDLRRAVVPIQ